LLNKSIENKNNQIDENILYTSELFYHLKETNNINKLNNDKLNEQENEINKLV